MSRSKDKEDYIPIDTFIGSVDIGGSKDEEKRAVELPELSEGGKEEPVESKGEPGEKKKEEPAEKKKEEPAEKKKEYTDPKLLQRVKAETGIDVDDIRKMVEMKHSGESYAGAGRSKRLLVVKNDGEIIYISSQRDLTDLTNTGTIVTYASRLIRKPGDSFIFKNMRIIGLPSK